jgi:general secretion pathway protein K
MTRKSPGFAILLVLWGLLALMLGAAALTAAARRALDEAAAVGAATQAAAAIDSAAQHAILHLLASGAAHWPPTSTQTIRFGTQTVSIALASQAGLVNPNTASAELLAALLTELGQSASNAASLADDIVEWRTEARIIRQRISQSTRYRAAGLDYAPPSAPFESIAELGLVLGMTPELLARLRPLLSLWWDGDPDPALAPPAIRAALDHLQAGAGLLGSNGSGITVVAITSRSIIGPGHAARRVVVQILPTATPPFRIVESTPIDDE